MSTEARLHELAHSVRQLLGCDQVSLCLSYPNASALHPLILLFRAIQPSSPLFYGSTLASQMFAHEKLWALYDLTGHVGVSPCVRPCPDESRSCAGARKVIPLRRSLGRMENQDGEMPGSAMLIVLERPAGIVGFLLCAARQTDAFKEGEQRLLTHYTPYLAELVEQIVSESCLSVAVQPELAHTTTEIQEHNTFLSLISHELRAPLMAIKGYVGLLQAYGSGSENEPVKMSKEQQRRYLAVTMQQVKHLEVLLGDVLDVSHIQAGRLTLHCTKIDIRPLFKRVVQEMQYRIEQQQPGRYHILCTIDPEISPAWADADRVQQVLTNLVENAIKYSPLGGLIEIRACTVAHCTHNCPCRERYIAPTYICITVRDQGIGIPRQQQSILFKPFTRLEHPATRHVSGSGLGLYIARKFVEAMHGQMVLRSREGKGTAITFTLPLAPSANIRRYP